MREILFRGQTRRKGEKVRMDGSPVESNWVYGGVLKGNGDHSIIYQTEPDIEKKVVYTDTLGQFTGLTDKNGTKIFEGDIVRYGDSIHKVVFEQQNGTAYQLEVIGNIYDNPELIGGAEDENS